MVREIVQEYLMRVDVDEDAVWAQRRDALERLRQIREQVDAQHGICQNSPIDEVR